MPSVLVNSLNELARRPITDEKERKEIYDAALQLAWSVESQQDTAQRLYHGVRRLVHSYLRLEQLV
jgi:hypothetical protein